MASTHRFTAAAAALLLLVALCAAPAGVEAQNITSEASATEALNAASIAANSSADTGGNATYFIGLALLTSSNLTVENSTIFIPDDEAFNFYQGSSEESMDSGSDMNVTVANTTFSPRTNVSDFLNATMAPATLTLLRLHIVPGVYNSTSIPDGNTTVPTLGGPDLTVNKATDPEYNITSITVYDPAGDNAVVLQPDIPFGTNVLHVISSVLLPKDAGAGSP